MQSILAYLAYGIMQAGSELSWHISGSYFAKNSDSTAYRSLNVISIGIHGCIAPILGTLIGFYTNAAMVMLIAFLLYLMATERMRAYGKKYMRNHPHPI